MIETMTHTGGILEPEQGLWIKDTAQPPAANVRNTPHAPLTHATLVIRPMAPAIPMMMARMTFAAQQGRALSLSLLHHSIMNAAWSPIRTIRPVVVLATCLVGPSMILTMRLPLMPRLVPALFQASPQLPSPQQPAAPKRERPPATLP